MPAVSTATYENNTREKDAHNLSWSGREKERHKQGRSVQGVRCVSGLVSAPNVPSQFVAWGLAATALPSICVPVHRTYCGVREVWQMTKGLFTSAHWRVQSARLGREWQCCGYLHRPIRQGGATRSALPHIQTSGNVRCQSLRFSWSRAELRRPRVRSVGVRSWYCIEILWFSTG
jgi:hypothetical protein